MAWGAAARNKTTRVFVPHGEVCAWLDGALVRFDVAGPFNSEGIERVLALRSRILAALPPPPFTALTTWRRSMLMPPEGLARLRQVIAGYLDPAGPRPVATAGSPAPNSTGGACSTICSRRSIVRRMSRFDCSKTNCRHTPGWSNF